MGETKAGGDPAPARSSPIISWRRARDVTGQQSSRTASTVWRILRRMGCSTEWGLFVGCAADAEIVCDTGEAVGCDSQPSDPAYACDRDFFARTGCGRLPDDSLCPAGQFYFLCTGGAFPTGCTLTPPEPSAGNYVCCPPFPD
jgi:hypothetical protein